MANTSYQNQPVNPGAYRKRPGDLSVELDPAKIKAQVDMLYGEDDYKKKKVPSPTKQKQPLTLLGKYNGF